MDAPAHASVAERLLEHLDGALGALAALGVAGAALVRHIRRRLPGQVFAQVRRDPSRETRIVPRPQEVQVDQQARDGVAQLRAQVEALEETVRAQAAEFRRADEAIVERVERANESTQAALLGLTEKVGVLIGLSSQRRRAGEGGE